MELKTGFDLTVYAVSYHRLATEVGLLLMSLNWTQGLSGGSFSYESG